MAANRSERRPELCQASRCIAPDAVHRLCPTNRVGNRVGIELYPRAAMIQAVKIQRGRGYRFHVARSARGVTFKPNTLISPGYWPLVRSALVRHGRGARRRDPGRPINRTSAPMGTVPGVLAIFRALALQAWATVRPQDCASTAVIHSATHRVEPSSPINALYVARVLRTPGSHFEASTPLTSSHSARDSSAMKIGIRNAMFARSGATSSRKLLTT